jgi:hypothetical protein
MLKRGLVVGAAAIAGILGIAVVASASEKKKPSTGPSEPTDAGFKGPNKQQCQDWYEERVQAINTVSALNVTIANIDYDIQQYNEASGGFGTPEDLIAARQKAVTQRNAASARANELAVLMQDCE